MLRYANNSDPINVSTDNIEKTMMCTFMNIAGKYCKYVKIKMCPLTMHCVIFLVVYFQKPHWPFANVTFFMSALFMSQVFIMTGKVALFIHEEGDLLHCLPF